MCCKMLSFNFFFWLCFSSIVTNLVTTEHSYMPGVHYIIGAFLPCTPHRNMQLIESMCLDID